MTSYLCLCLSLIPLVLYIFEIWVPFEITASYKPNLIVPPKFFSLPFIIFFPFCHSCSNPITGVQLFPNSLDEALLIFNKFLAASIIAICMPKQMPKKGILFSLAYLIASILPSAPLFPNPPGIKIPESCVIILFKFDFFNLSDSILTKLTLVLLLIPP